jgi:hypothetical protein
VSAARFVAAVHNSSMKVSAMHYGEEFAIFLLIWDDVE